MLTVLMATILWVTPVAPAHCDLVYYTQVQNAYEEDTLFEDTPEEMIMCTISLLPVGTLENFNQDEVVGGKYI